MAYSKTFTKLLSIGIVCLALLMLSVKVRDWQGQYTQTTVRLTKHLALSVNRSTTPKDELKKAFETMTPNFELAEKRLPNCIIIGFSKCGTHALRTFLSLHPSVVSVDRELSFFTKHYVNGLEWYREQMPLSLPNQIIIEKTPSYILYKEAIMRMYDFNPSVKLIILVRDPVVRVQSLYARAVFKAGDDFNKSFINWVKERVSFSSLMKIGNYAPYIRDVLSIFNKEQILFLDGELLSRSPQKVLQICERFLNITSVFKEDFFIYNEEKGFFCVNTATPFYDELMNSGAKTKIKEETGCFGETKGRVHPKMAKQLEKRLVNIYRATSEDLFHVIGKRFEWTGLGDVNGEEDILD